MATDRHDRNCLPGAPDDLRDLEDLPTPAGALTAIRSSVDTASRAQHDAREVISASACAPRRGGRSARAPSTRPAAKTVGDRRHSSAASRVDDRNVRRKPIALFCVTSSMAIRGRGKPSGRSSRRTHGKKLNIPSTRRSGVAAPPTSTRELPRPEPIRSPASEDGSDSTHAEVEVKSSTVNGTWPPGLGRRCPTQPPTWVGQSSSAGQPTSARRFFGAQSDCGSQPVTRQTPRMMPAGTQKA